MGTIHQLNPPARGSTAEIDPAKAVQCEIVIFPGVRIERHHDVTTALWYDPTDHDGAGDDHRPRKSS